MFWDNFACQDILNDTILSIMSKDKIWVTDIGPHTSSCGTLAVVVV